MEHSIDATEVHSLLNETHTLLDELQFGAIILTQSLTGERNDLNRTLQSAACARESNCRAARDLIDLDRLAVSTFYDQTTIRAEMMQAGYALHANLTSLALSSRATLESVPHKIAEEGSPHIQDIKDMIQDMYTTGIEGFVEFGKDLGVEVTDKLVTSLSPTSGERLSQTLYDGIHKAVIYDQYRFYSGIGSVCVFIVIILCNYLGVLFGECGRDKQDHPTERGCLSNFGGTLLLGGVAFSFLFSGVMMSATTAIFLAGGGTEKAFCNPIQTKSILKEIVDHPNLLAPREPYFLGDFLLGDGEQPILAEHLLEKCERNAAILTTMETNLTTSIARVLLNFSKDSFRMDSINLTNFTTFDDEVGASFRLIRDTCNMINVSNTMHEVGQSITKVELMDFATILRTTSDSVSNSTLQNQLRAHAIKLNALRYSFVLPMRSKVNELERMLISLHNKTRYLSDLMNNLLQRINETEDFLREQGPSILEEEISLFQDHLISFLEQAADFIIFELTTDLGHCRPLSNVYSSLDVLLCDYTSDSLNTMWFTLGGCVILLIPSIIFAVKLSKFYRRMKYFEDIYGENGESTIPMQAFGSKWNSEVPGPALERED